MAFKHRRLLELPPDAELGDVSLILFREVDTVFKQHRARVRPRLAGDDIHHRRLARAIRADDGAEFTGLHHEGERVERLETIERNGNAIKIKQAFGSVFGNRVHGLTPPPVAQPRCRCRAAGQRLPPARPAFRGVRRDNAARCRQCPSGRTALPR
ncbi:hypothetical protein D3C78_1457860 [compost metagenome]